MGFRQLTWHSDKVQNNKSTIPELVTTKVMNAILSLCLWFRDSKQAFISHFSMTLRKDFTTTLRHQLASMRRS